MNIFKINENYQQNFLLLWCTAKKPTIYQIYFLIILESSVLNK